MNFDYTQFARALSSNDPDLSVHNAQSDNGWFYFDEHSSDPFNQVIEYNYQGKDNYRTWHQEISITKNNLGMIVSTKIDHIRGDNKDDHIALITGFDASGKLNFAQAFIQMKEEDPVSTTIVKSGDIPGQIHDQIDANMKDDYGINGSNDGRQKIPHIVKVNINCMTKAVTL
jgi:hypothetical protein